MLAHVSVSESDENPEEVKTRKHLLLEEMGELVGKEVYSARGKVLP